MSPYLADRFMQSEHLINQSKDRFTAYSYINLNHSYIYTQPLTHKP